MDESPLVIARITLKGVQRHWENIRDLKASVGAIKSVVASTVEAMVDARQLLKRLEQASPSQF